MFCRGAHIRVGTVAVLVSVIDIIWTGSLLFRIDIEVRIPTVL